MTKPFLWGVGTSAYQIEGARHAGGKGESVWDRFSDLGRVPGNGDVAADHYHRLEEDLDLLAGLGIGAYRFSTAWTRVVPDGDGAINRAGLDFYERLISGLEARDIEPCLTHQGELWDRGGGICRQGRAAADSSGTRRGRMCSVRCASYGSRNIR